MSADLATLVVQNAGELSALFTFDEQNDETRVLCTWPIQENTEKIILEFVQKTKLEVLQSKFGSLCRAVSELKNKYQSGRRSDMSSKEKRKLAKQIGSGNKKRSNILTEMVPYIQYLRSKENPVFTILLPKEDDLFHIWAEAAMSGMPFWACEKSEAELKIKKAKEEAVEKFLKLNRAIEHITAVIPREMRDAHNFFSEMEEDLKVHILPTRQYLQEVCLEEVNTRNGGTEFHLFCLGLYAMGRDTLINLCKARVNLEELAAELTVRFSPQGGDLHHLMETEFQTEGFQIRPTSFSWPSFTLPSANYTSKEYVEPYVPDATRTKNRQCIIVPSVTQMDNNN